SLAVRDPRRDLAWTGSRDALRTSRPGRGAPRRRREARAAAGNRRENGLGPVAPRALRAVAARRRAPTAPGPPPPRPRGAGPRPTAPLFAILEGRLDDRHRSLDQMRATSAPEPWDSLPGLP